jgi:CDP-glucose 4,6-dehydratase
MEGMVAKSLFWQTYQNRKVLVTGHTGFKGSWLSLWLSQMGANVVGYSLPPDTNPSHFELLEIDCVSIISDIRDAERLTGAVTEHRPEIVFHLAAQPLVRKSYREPVETFQTNIMGLVNILEACRHTDSVKAIVVITSDKCYEDQKFDRGYSEVDKLGGYDPYSASKGCAEIITACYRRSFFNSDKAEQSCSALIASARAGNVIGGGDWSDDRLIPDIVRAAARNNKVVIRNPDHIRAWQHVLEPLSGYLMLGQQLLQGSKDSAHAWNFGPTDEQGITVNEVVLQMKRCWDKVNYDITKESSNLHETSTLKLDCSKAHQKLAWEPIWDMYQGIEMAAVWYKAYYEQDELLTCQQLTEYINRAKQKGAKWTQ